MKIPFAILVFSIVFTFSNFVSAWESYEYFHVKDGRYFCSTFGIDDEFQECWKFGFTEKDFLEWSSTNPEFPVGRLFPTFLKAWEESFCIKDDEQLDISACKKSTRFMKNLEWSYTCTIQDGEMTNCFYPSYSAEPQEEMPIMWMTVFVNGEKVVPQKTKPEYVWPKKSQKTSGYFTRTDGKTYCIQWDKAEPIEKQFYYTLCDEIGFETLSGEYHISRDETEMVGKHINSGLEHPLPNWVYFGKMNQLLCLDDEAKESSECAISYIKWYDDTYLCLFGLEHMFPLLECSLFPEIIDLSSGIPQAKWGYTIEEIPGVWRNFWKDANGIYREVNYDKWEEVVDMDKFHKHPSRINAMSIINTVSEDRVMAENTVVAASYSSWSASCTVNGKVVDCVELWNQVKWVVKTGIGILLGLLFLWFIFAIFWIVMLVHIFSNPIPNKLLWILVVAFLSPIGAIVYYFAIKRTYQNGGVTNQNPPSSTSGVCLTPTPILPQTPVPPPSQFPTEFTLSTPPVSIPPSLSNIPVVTEAPLVAPVFVEPSPTVRVPVITGEVPVPPTPSVTATPTLPIADAIVAEVMPPSLATIATPVVSEIVASAPEVSPPVSPVADPLAMASPVAPTPAPIPSLEPATPAPMPPTQSPTV